MPEYEYECTECGYILTRDYPADSVLAYCIKVNEECVKATRVWTPPATGAGSSGEPARPSK